MGAIHNIVIATISSTGLLPGNKSNEFVKLPMANHGTLNTCWKKEFSSYKCSLNMLSRADLLCMKHAAKARKAWDRIFKHEKIGGWLQIGANGTSCREMCSFLFEFTF